MSPTLETTNTLFTTLTLNEIARQEGPAVTLLIAGQHPGSREASRAVLLRGMARSVMEMVTAHDLDPATVQPLNDFISRFEDKGGPGIAVFCSPGCFNAVEAPGIVESKLVLSHHFYLVPLVTSVLSPQEFYVLGLNRKYLRLCHYSNGKADSVDLPPQVPANMEAALAFDQPDHRMENSSPAGSSTGAMRSVRFGTASDREKAANKYLLQFFQIVNRGLKPWLKGTPLLLAGVHEEVTAYRGVAGDEMLLHAEIPGNIDYLSLADIAERARDAAVAHYRWLGETVLAKFREMPNRRRTRSAVRAILTAAAAGRVHQLCAAEGAEVRGSTKRHAGFADEDLVNAAVVETLRHGGEVFMLPGGTMPKATPLAAILRF